MQYLIIVPLVAGAVFALVVFLRRGTRPATKRDAMRLAVVAGGFVLLAVSAAIHLALNGGWS